MRRMSQLGRILAGGGLIAGAFAFLSLFAKATLAVETLKDFKEAVEVYAKHWRTPLATALGLNDLPFASYFLDVFVLWSALFLAINAFVQYHDGLFIWGHIGRGYCFRERQTRLAQARCIIPKVLIAFLATPWVFLVAIWSTVVTGQASITMAYMTVEPKMIARYLLAFLFLPAFVLAALSFLTRLWA